MKIIEVTEDHQLPGNLGDHPDALSLYKECLVKNKKILLVKVKTSGGEIKSLPLTSFHRDVQKMIMTFFHREALAGRHI